MAGAKQIGDVEAILAGIERDREGAFSYYGEKKKRLCRDMLLFARCRLVQTKDQAQADVGWMQDAMARLASGERVLAGYIGIHIATIHMLRGDLKTAEEALENARKSIVADGSTDARIAWYRQAAFIARLQGRLHRGEALVAEAIDYLESTSQSDIPGRVTLYMPKATIAYIQNDIEEAHRDATTFLAYAERAGFVDDLTQGHLLLALIHVSRGEKRSALDHIHAMQAVARKTGIEHEIALGDAFAAFLHVLMGNIAHIHLWSLKRRLRPDEPFSLTYMSECMVQAMLHCIQRRYARALTLLEQLRPRCEKRGIRGTVIGIDAQRAALYRALDQRDRAMAALEQALIPAAEENYLRPFLDNLPGLPRVLGDLAARKAEVTQTDFFKTICTARGIPLFMNNQNASPVPIRLTPREIEILALIREGYRNMEIADKANISLNTVKTHSKNIFDKLDVATRVQAIRKAEALNLLEDRSD